MGAAVRQNRNFAANGNLTRVELTRGTDGAKSVVNGSGVRPEKPRVLVRLKILPGRALAAELLEHPQVKAWIPESRIGRTTLPNNFSSRLSCTKRRALNRVLAYFLFAALNCTKTHGAIS
jgi:hypothetical protein